MKLVEKQQLVEDLHDRFSRAKVVIVTDFKGLNVTVLNGLRRQLRDAGVEYRVVKNTLLALASENTGVSVIRDHFKGPSAVAMSFDDPVAPAKVLTAFAKDNEKLQIRVAALDGKLLDLSQIKSLADLPPREVLLAKLLGTFNAVPSGFVRVLNAIPTQLLTVLQAIKEKKQGEAEA